MGNAGQTYRGFWNGPLGLVVLAAAFAGAIWLGWRTVADLWVNGPPHGGSATKGAALGLILPAVTGWAFIAGLRSGWRRLRGK